MIAPFLWIQSAQLPRLQYPFARDNESGGSQRNLALRGHLPDGLESLRHHPVKPAVDLLLGPKKTCEILHPFKVADRHAPGIGKHIRHDQDTLVTENIICLRRSRAVGALDQDLRADAAGVTP